eukprot:TRINITY_DN4936_c0_g1_i1.p1 TRINITY_DN4936_c0_g1~~TRINITY_DN4936_c0_g1_i1.p1  ORF type:complete len:190 (-),score=32.28 TRINITY_DN4936_c0_g1_i1:73-642(-)
MKKIRQETLHHFEEFLPEQIAYHMELCVFTDFDYFTGTYSEKSRELLNTLENNAELLEQISTGEIKPHVFLHMDLKQEPATEDNSDEKGVEKIEILEPEQGHLMNSMNELHEPPIEDSPPSDSANVTPENNLERDQDKHCCICLDNEKTHAVVPCGHKCCCGDCANDVLNSRFCPLCRGEISHVIKIFD